MAAMPARCPTQQSSLGKGKAQESSKASVLSYSTAGLGSTWALCFQRDGLR